MKRYKLENLLVHTIVVLVFAILIGLGIWMQYKAPCWMFQGHSITDVPARCLVHGGLK